MSVNVYDFAWKYLDRPRSERWASTARPSHNSSTTFVSKSGGPQRRKR